MPVILVAVLQTLVYLAAVPVCAAFSLSTRGGLRLGVGVSAFGTRAALRRAAAGNLPARKRRRRGGGAVGPVWRAIRRLRGARLCLKGRLGLGDAAATATACGALLALAAALGAGVGRVEVDVVPLFGCDAPCVELQGMIRLRSGQIIGALAVSGANELRRRISRWTDIRLKA